MKNTATDFDLRHLERLLQDMREFTERTGWGLAETWGLIRQGKFAEARERMDALLADPPQSHHRTH